ncbi:MAG: extracellular solute-binding protein family 5 [Flavipsychrobacter sp.]|nr:extracellular solute-binding protein family 5 [Flavipsychrobacter sp.]
MNNRNESRRSTRPHLSFGEAGRGLLLVLLLLSSCAQKETNSTKHVFHLNLSSGYLESIDPAFAKFQYMIWIDHMVYNTLVETDEHMHTIPSLAKSWDVSPDGLHYSFHLRSDVYFHDNPIFPGGKGRKMAAADVAYTFYRLIDPKTASSGAWIFNGRIAEKDPFVAVDDSTIQVNLITPFRPLPEMLTNPYCSIVPKEVIEHWGKEFRNHPCGTGPFMFSYWDEGNALNIIKNPHYWEHDNAGVQLPYLDAVQITFVDSKATEFLLFMQGKVDFVNGIDGSFKDLLFLKNGTLRKEFRDKFRISKGTYLNVEYIGFLTDTTLDIMKGEPTANPLIRRAINYAINRQKIVTYFKNGQGTPATHGFIPAGLPGYDSSATYGYNYDPAKALQLLEQAGYPHGKGLKPIKILAQDNYVDIVNFVATQLQEVGIPTTIEVIQPNILKQQMSRSKAVIFRGGWFADYPDAETFLVVFNSRFPAPPNYTRFSNPTFDQWYNESLNMPDTPRWQLYHKMDSLAMSFAPILPLYYDELLHFTQNNITGFSSNSMNLIELKRVKKN